MIPTYLEIEGKSKSEVIKIKELLNIPGIVGVKELVALSSTYKAFTPVEDFVKEYYKGEN